MVYSDFLNDCWVVISCWVVKARRKNDPSYCYYLGIGFDNFRKNWWLTTTTLHLSFQQFWKRTEKKMSWDPTPFRHCGSRPFLRQHPLRTSSFKTPLATPPRHPSFFFATTIIGKQFQQLLIYKGVYLLIQNILYDKRM